MGRLRQPCGPCGVWRWRCVWRLPVESPRTSPSRAVKRRSSKELVRKQHPLLPDSRGARSGVACDVEMRSCFEMATRFAIRSRRPITGKAFAMRQCRQLPHNAGFQNVIGKEVPRRQVHSGERPRPRDWGAARSRTARPIRQRSGFPAGPWRSACRSGQAFRPFD